MSDISTKKYILFDLDGTLTDSYPAITHCFLEAIKDYKDVIITERDLASIIGPPLKESFMRLLGVDGFEAWDLVEKFREYYNAGGIFNCTVYPGIEDLLIALKQGGKTLVVATSKPEDQAIRVLEYFGLSKYFFLIAGDEHNCSRANKKDLLIYCLDRLGNPNPSDVVMIGDRIYDVKSANELGITSIAVTFGYGSKREIEEGCPDFIVNSAFELKELLLL